MRNRMVLLLIFCGFTPFLWATDGCNQHLSPEEFRNKQQDFITEKAKLTRKEAAEFFPVYFELQDKKKELNDRIGKLMRQGKDEKTTEAQYKEIIDSIYELRIALNEWEKTYYDKFKKVLSYKKIYMVQKAEMHFHRELLKKMNREGGEPRKDKK